MTNTAIQQLFEAQRTVLEQTHSVARLTVDMRQVAPQTTAAFIEALEETTERNDEATREIVGVYLDALGETLTDDSDIDSVREAFETALDNAADARSEQFDRAEEALNQIESMDEEFAEAHEEAVEKSFEAFYDGHTSLQDAVEELNNEE